MHLMAEDIEDDTIAGLWSLLMGLVPARKRSGATAAGNAISFLTERRARREGFEAAERQRADAYTMGFAAGETAARLALRGQAIGITPDDEPQPTKH